MLLITHNTLFVIVYFLATSFDFTLTYVETGGQTINWLQGLCCVRLEILVHMM